MGKKTAKVIIKAKLPENPLRDSLDLARSVEIKPDSANSKNEDTANQSDSQQESITSIKE